MAIKLPPALLGAIGRARARPAVGSPCFCRRALSTEAAPPPLLAKLKGDLKAAMKAKDAARLTVLRLVLASTLNASKTNAPIQTDAQMVALLRKTTRSSQDAVDEFRAAGREDLAGSEEAQIKVLEEYVSGSGIETVTGDGLGHIVRTVMSGTRGRGRCRQGHDRRGNEAPARTWRSARREGRREGRGHPRGKGGERRSLTGGDVAGCIAPLLGALDDVQYMYIICVCWAGESPAVASAPDPVPRPTP